ncbi:MAG TPA: lamin tail domain-containing protein [Candidatus Paceibacterota bacterium]|nr:lamin tail domain-containing protein [Candidatus Paceibacterota bacterium]
MKKIWIHNIILLLLLVPHLVAAQVVISEVMYDPLGADTGHEWLEVYNASTSSVPLTTWKLYEGDANHNIIAASGDATLAPSTYGVIASNATKFSADYPDFAGTLFHSAVSLDNAGESITLRDKSLTDIDTVSYDSSEGALGDGNSLQRSPGDMGSFTAHTPTPGASISTTTITPKSKPVSPVKPPKPKKSTSAKIRPASSNTDIRASNDAGNMSVVAPQAAAVATRSTSSYWFFALAAVIFLSIAALAVSRHVKKSEWDIVEESPEDV